MADVEQVIIIGSGPAGYTAALYTARANLSPLVIEGFLWGGLLQQTTDVENYPGFRDGIMGPELMQTMRDQAERFGARFITDNATALRAGRRRGRRRTPSTSATRPSRRARSILAMGAEHKKLGVPGEEELANGRGVSYCATCDAAFFKDRETIIVGGGDSAMEEAIFLAKFSSKVTVVHRRDEFRASKIMLDRARADGEHRAADPVPGGGVPRPARAGCSARPGCATPRRARSASCRCPARSWRSATSRRPSSSTGMVETDENGYVVTEGRSTRTALPGVFAAGDLVDHTYRQAVTAAGHGLHGRAGRRVVPARQPARPHPGRARGHGRPRRGSSGRRRRASTASALSAADPQRVARVERAHAAVDAERDEARHGRGRSVGEQHARRSGGRAAASGPTRPRERSHGRRRRREDVEVRVAERRAARARGRSRARGRGCGRRRPGPRSGRAGRSASTGAPGEDGRARGRPSTRPLTNSRSSLGSSGSARRRLAGQRAGRCRARRSRWRPPSRGRPTSRAPSRTTWAAWSGGELRPRGAHPRHGGGRPSAPRTRCRTRAAKPSGPPVGVEARRARRPGSSSPGRAQVHRRVLVGEERRRWSSGADRRHGQDVRAGWPGTPPGCPRRTRCRRRPPGTMPRATARWIASYSVRQAALEP